MGIVDLAIKTLKGYGRDKRICDRVLVTLSNSLQLAHVRGVAVPSYDNNVLILNIVLAMKRFPSHENIQSSSCSLLRGMLVSVSSDIEVVEESSIAAAMASIGVYELVFAALERFPATFGVAVAGSLVLL